MLRCGMRTTASIAVLALFTLAGCVTTDESSALGAAERVELLELYEAHDFFGLRERLLELNASAETPVHLFFAAVTQHVFNDPGGSSRALESLLDDDRLDTELRRVAFRIARDNYIRLHRYPEAARMAEAALGDATEPLEDARNTLRLLQAIADVPPQRATIRGSSNITLQTNARAPWLLIANKIDALASPVEAALADLTRRANSRARRRGVLLDRRWRRRRRRGRIRPGRRRIRARGRICARRVLCHPHTAHRLASPSNGRDDQQYRSAGVHEIGQ